MHEALSSISSTENKRRGRIRDKAHKMAQWIKKGACHPPSLITLHLSPRVHMAGENLSRVPHLHVQAVSHVCPRHAKQCHLKI